MMLLVVQLRQHRHPRLIQCCCVCSLAMGTRMNMTKFVEWPVVLRTPTRALSLYTNTWYLCAVPRIAPVYSSGRPITSSISPLTLGYIWNIEQIVYNSRGRDSAITCFPTSQRAPH